MFSGPMHCIYVSGYDKLEGIQRNTYPLTVYGGIDTYSRKVLFLRIGESNRDQDVVGYYWLDYLCENKVCPRFLAIDNGAQMDVICGLHKTVKQRLIDTDGTGGLC